LKPIHHGLLFALLVTNLPLQEPAALAAEAALLDDGAFIRVPVHAFGATNYFILDTAAAITVVDLSFESQLGKSLKSTGAESAVSEQFDLAVYPAPAMRWGDYALPLNRVGAADLQMARMISGEPCAGMLGVDALLDSTLSIDFERNCIAVSKGKGRPANDAFIPLRKRPDNRLAVEVTINDSEKALLLLDSSDSSSLSLNLDDWNRVFKAQAQKVGKTAFYSGVNGSVRTSQVARISALNVHGEKYTNLLCSLIPNRRSTSHLGLSFLRRHMVTN
jgi:hypothetical protein